MNTVSKDVVQRRPPTLEGFLNVDHHEVVLVLLDLIVDVPGYGVYLGPRLLQIVLHQHTTTITLINHFEVKYFDHP